MNVKVVSIIDIKDKESFMAWVRTLPVIYPPKRLEVLAEKAMRYDKCIWSRNYTNELDPGLNFFKIV